MDLGLTNKTVLVTGGASGIGAATVRLFAEEGAQVILVDRDELAAHTLASSIPKTSVVIDEIAGFQLDGLITQIRRLTSHLDILVHNAGFNDGIDLTEDPRHFLESLNKNLHPTIALTHAFRQNLIDARGNIIMVGSKVSVTGQGHTTAYAAAKGAINSLTREWAAHFAPHGVRVNTVLPAECDTSSYQQWFTRQENPVESRRNVENLVPFENRLTRPDEIADAIVWLASRRASHITGQLLFVDGGYTHLDRALSSSHRW